MFYVAIRGIPSFSFVQNIQVSNFEEIWERFGLRVKSRVFGYETKFLMDNKPVMLYIDPSEHQKEVLQKFTMPIKGSGCSMTFKDGVLRSSGTARSSGDWFMIEPENHPDYIDVKTLCDEEVRKERKIKEERERIEEEKHEYLESLVDKYGIDRVIESLSNLE